MKITPKDILHYTYCPTLYKKQKHHEVILPKLTTFEKFLRKTIIETEKNCLLKDSDITPRKFLRVWDKIWWPNIQKIGVSFKESEELSIIAAKKFTNYCKYDFTSYMFPAVTCSQKSIIQINDNYIHGYIDLLKVDLTNKNKNKVLIDFGRKNMMLKDLLTDTGISSNAYTFYSGGEQIFYISVDLCDKSNNIEVSSVLFRDEYMKQTKKMIKYISESMSNDVYYFNRWNCEECKICVFKSLTKRDFH